MYNIIIIIIIIVIIIIITGQKVEFPALKEIQDLYMTFETDVSSTLHEEEM